MLRQYSLVKEQLMARRERLSSQESVRDKEAPVGGGKISSEAPKDAAESLLDEEELEEELVQRSPTIRLEREREYAALLKLKEDLAAGKELQERGDGEGMPKFPIKHKGLEMPPDWVFEDFMAQRVPIGLAEGFTDD